MVDKQGEKELRFVQLEETGDEARLFFLSGRRLPTCVSSLQIRAVARTLDLHLPLCAAAFGADELTTMSGTGPFSSDFVARPTCRHGLTITAGRLAPPLSSR